MDAVKKWEESGLLSGVVLGEHRKILAMSLEEMARRLKTMTTCTQDEELDAVSTVIFPIVRRLVIKAQFVPITDFAGLVDKVQKEYKRFRLEFDDDIEKYSVIDLEAEFCARFAEEHVGMF